jgi:ParB-like chromosome segregation protein Spo0J
MAMTRQELIVTVPKPTFDGLVPHPLAGMMPLIDGEAFDNLKADIAKQGILEPIRLYEGKILDGRNRYRAARECGHRFAPENFREWVGTLEEAEAFVLSTNFQRRQLKDAQKREIIRAQIVKNPDKSDRKIAALYGFSHVTVGKVREAMRNPPDLVKFNRWREEFKRTFDGLSDEHRLAFVREWELDFRELLAERTP